jgi:hypothetical protein
VQSEAPRGSRIVEPDREMDRKCAFPDTTFELTMAMSIVGNYWRGGLSLQAFFKEAYLHACK